MERKIKENFEFEVDIKRKPLIINNFYFEYHKVNNTAHFINYVSDYFNLDIGTNTYKLNNNKTFYILLKTNQNKLDELYILLCKAYFGVNKIVRNLYIEIHKQLFCELLEIIKLVNRYRADSDIEF